MRPFFLMNESSSAKRGERDPTDPITAPKKKNKPPIIRDFRIFGPTYTMFKLHSSKAPQVKEVEPEEPPPKLCCWPFHKMKAPLESPKISPRTARAQVISSRAADPRRKNLAAVIAKQKSSSRLV